MTTAKFYATDPEKVARIMAERERRRQVAEARKRQVTK